MADLAKSCREIVQKLGLIVEVPDSEIRPFIKWLAETGTPIIPACRKCATGTDLAYLLIVDDMEYGEGLSSKWPSQLDNGSIIVTSRRTEIRDHGFTYPTEVHPFGAEGSKLLLSILQATNAGTKKDGLEASLSISQQLGGLPLAIVHIAGYMVKNWQFQHYLSPVDESNKLEPRP